MSGARKLRVTIGRNDLCVLIDALEEVIEGYKYDGGIVLCSDEIRLEEYLKDRLHFHDKSHQYRPAPPPAISPEGRA